LLSDCGKKDQGNQFIYFRISHNFIFDPMMIDNREHIVFGGTDYLIVIDPQIALNRPNKTKILLTELQINHHKVKVGEKSTEKLFSTRKPNIPLHLNCRINRNGFHYRLPKQAPTIILIVINTGSKNSATTGSNWIYHVRLCFRNLYPVAMSSKYVNSMV